jgi:DNA-directed RNA polymerase specialized sigma24 family protein
MQDAAVELSPGAERVRAAYEAAHAPRWRAVLAYSGSTDVRACVVLCDLAGHDAPSAARLLSTTAATVRVQLMRSRRRLRELLEETDA